MSTLDVIAQVGGSPANFCDLGGGGDAQGVVDALEVITADPQVEAILFNIFGGITRCDEVARGILEALGRLTIEQPIVVRLDGTNAEEGRRLLAEAAPPNLYVEATMLDGGRRRPSSWRASGDHRHQRHAARRPGHHRARGLVPRDAQPRLRHERRRRGDAGQGRRGRRRDPGLRHGCATRSPRPARTRRWSSSRRASPPTRSSRRSTRGSRRSSASPRASRPTTCCASTTTCGREGVTLIGPNCPGVPLAGQGERRDHPGRDLQRRAASASSPARGR